MTEVRHESIPDVYKLSGPRTKALEFQAKELLPDFDSEFVMILWWEASSYLSCSGKLDNNQPLLNDLKSLRTLAEAYGKNESQISRSIQTGQNHFLCQRLAPDDVVRLTVKIDTNHKDFNAQKPHDLGNGIMGLEIVLTIAGFDTKLIRQSEIRITLEKVKALEKYHGYVALDLGNTNSTLVCLRNGEEETDEIEVIDVEDSGMGRPVLSALRILNFTQSDDNPLSMPPSKYVIGQNAMRGSSGWLALSAKRMLADSDCHTPHHALLDGHPTAIPKQAPAELFAARMFAKFGERKRHRVGPIAITYPTTFSTWEMGQLKEAVYNGIRRSVGASKYLPTETEGQRDERDARMDMAIPVILDEASAAAVFFLYRDFVKAPGGLCAFRYLYPQGINLLLYDCGGGTTDIALVHADGLMQPDPLTQRMTYGMKIKVLGRTGDRTFGGDNMTVAAFQILKAKIAAALSGGNGLQLPSAPSEYEGYLKSNAGRINDLVPTRFVGLENTDSETVRLKMEATLELWQWAESSKISLSGGKDYIYKFPGNSRLAKLLLQATETNDSSSIEKKLSNIQLSRAELDALIDGSVIETVRKMNDMVGEKLTGKYADQEVNRIYVVGNASRYPLIGERIHENLNVRFIDQRYCFDKDNLKHAVAKGAAIALSIRNELHDGFFIIVDKDLPYRLPFDITISSPGTGSPRLIYQENQHIEQLGDELIPVSQNEDENNDGRTAFLKRRWPGDAKSSNYLEFRFDKHVDGPVKVWYAKDRRLFLAQDQSGYEPVEGRESTHADFTSPVQSGEL